jgi:hypothetical protein
MSEPRFGLIELIILKIIYQLNKKNQGSTVVQTKEMILGFVTQHLRTSAE